VTRLGLIVLLALLCGCAGAGFNVPAFQNDVARGNYPAALKQLDRFPDKDVSALLDRGLLLQAEGKYDESNAAFDAAEIRIDDLYTRSMSKEALALLTNDFALDYRASGFEHAYVAYYRAWNYLEAGEPEGVLVEARKIGERLDFRSQSCGDQGGACGHDLFLRYMSGLFFEWGNEANDAYVAYKQADKARETSRTEYGVDAPPDLGERLVRLAHRLGFRDEEAEFADSYGLDPTRVLADPPGSVVAIWENGMIGRREETNAFIPIMKGESEGIASDQNQWSKRLATRWRQPYRKEELDYLLRISLPRYVDRAPAAARAEFVLGETSRPTEDLAPLAAMAGAALDQAMGEILIRAIGRGLVKYLATKRADKEGGEGAGLLINLLGVGLERADTRSWRSLPHDIQVAAVPAEPGTYGAVLRVLDPQGKVLDERRYPEVRVPPSGIAFVRHRSTP
jgi:uncharacterized protein